MGDLHTSSPNALKTTLIWSLLMRPVFLDVEVGDVVAVNPPHAAAYLAEVIYVEGGARFSDPNFLQVVREDDCAVLSICPSWVTDRLPGRREPKPNT